MKIFSFLEHHDFDKIVGETGETLSVLAKADFQWISKGHLLDLNLASHIDGLLRLAWHVGKLELLLLIEC
jgi:hypothetical protein